MTRAAYCLVGLLRPDASQEGLSKDTTFSQQPSRSCTRARVAVQVRGWEVRLSRGVGGGIELNSVRGPELVLILSVDSVASGPDLFATTRALNPQKSARATRHL